MRVITHVQPCNYVSIFEYQCSLGKYCANEHRNDASMYRQQ